VCLAANLSFARDDVGAEADGDFFDATAFVSDSSTTASPTSASSGGTTYSYVPMCVRGEGMPGEAFYGCGEQMVCGADDEGLYFTLVAHLPDGSMESLGGVCIGPGDEPVQQQVTQAAVLRAFQRIPVPASEVVIQPPGGETLVNLDTIFSTQAEGFTRTIGLLGHRVDLDITPSEFRWVNGDGTVQVTDWAGRPWAKGTPLGEFITHRYGDADKSVQPRVDTTWTARYRVDGGPWRDVGGTVTISGDPFDLAVLSAQPHLAG
jgi:hypothetical protein